MDEVKPRDIAISLAGHDKGRVYLVLRTDSAYAYLVDGKIRKLANPKKKSLKHLRLGKTGDEAQRPPESFGEAADSVIRKQLAIFRNETE